MSYPLIIGGIILGGLLTLLSIIFAIISLSGGKNRNAIIWAVAFVVSVGIVAFSVFSLFQETASRFRESLEAMTAAQTNSYGDYGDTGDQKNERQYWLDTLQKYTNEKYEGQVPADYYINKPATEGAGVIIRVPFVYPYYIMYNTDNYTGNIMMDGSDSIFVQNVTAMSFDQNFAIIKTDNSMSPEMLSANHAETEYLLYDLRTRNFETAANKEKLLDLANRIGYTGSTEMGYLSVSYSGWIPQKDYNY